MCLQINGAVGVDFSDPALTDADVKKVARSLLQHGVTSFLPTIVSSGAKVYRHATSVIQPCDGLCAEPAYRTANILGLHLEGT